MVKVKFVSVNQGVLADVALGPALSFIQKVFGMPVLHLQILMN